MKIDSWLDAAVAQGLFRSIDRHFGLLMAELSGADSAVVLAAALVSRRSADGPCGYLRPRRAAHATLARRARGCRP